jgi:hypothetical protein
VTAIACFVAAGCGGTGSVTSLPGLGPARLARLSTIVRATVTGLGDAHPSSVTVFATRHRVAAAATGHVARSRRDQPVYLVVARGRFSCAGCVSSAPESAVVVTLVLSRATLRPLSGGGFGGAVNVDDVGPGMRLVLRPYRFHD